jgi:hypothetical protein
MKNFAVRLSPSDNKLVRAFLALLAATILGGSAMLEVSADVNLPRFEARWQDDGTVVVVWEASSEIDSIAYFLYRAESPDGPWQDYIAFEPATGNEFTPATYSFTDEEVSRNITYYYRLEEIAADNSREFFGPIVPTTGSMSPATNTPATTLGPKPEQSALPPTATRQYTDTPLPAGTGTSPVSAAETQPPALTATPVQAALTRPLTPLVTTPTPVGGIAPTVGAPTLSPEVTDTPEGGLPQPTVGVTDTVMPSLPSAQETPIQLPTVQQLAAAHKETSQPLLDASATRLAPAPNSKAAQHRPPNSQFGLLVGGGTLVAAALLGAVLLLIWRRRAR